MNVLDENIRPDQRVQLRRWRIRHGQIGHELGRIGMPDDELLTLLLTLRRPTFFSRDRDFFRPGIAHQRYCPVYLDVAPWDTAAYIRRFLRHPSFATQTQRMGAVVHAGSGGIEAWHLHQQGLIRLPWHTE